MAAGMDHSISPEGLQELLEELPTENEEAFRGLHAAAPELPQLLRPLLIFVTPLGVYEDSVCSEHYEKVSAITSIE